MAQKVTLYYRDWRIDATDRTGTGTKGNQHFKLTQQPCFEEALRAVKQEVNEREGEQVWIEGYTNECLLSPRGYPRDTPLGRDQEVL